MTAAENRIWSRLRAHRLDGASFRRQVPIGPYIADFACLQSRLVIELDGGQHADSSRDIERDAWLRAQGFSVLRYWNNDVLSNTDGVIEDIVRAIAEAAPPLPNPPPQGGREQAATRGTLDG